MKNVVSLAGIIVLCFIVGGCTATPAPSMQEEQLDDSQPQVEDVYAYQAELDETYYGFPQFDTSSYNDDEQSYYDDIMNMKDNAYAIGDIDTLYSLLDELYALDEKVQERISVEEEHATQNGVIYPFNGNFDYTDMDGYSYHFEYSAKLPSATVDTTVGKPGEVGIVQDPLSMSVTITNTTPGKKAPLPTIKFILLYPDGQISGAIDSLSLEGKKIFSEDVNYSVVGKLCTFANPIPTSVDLPEDSDNQLRMHDTYEQMAAIYGAGPCFELRMSGSIFLPDMPYGFGTNPGRILDVGERTEYQLYGMGDLRYGFDTFIVPESDAELIVQTITTPVGLAFGADKWPKGGESVAFSERIPLDYSYYSASFNWQFVWAAGYIEETSYLPQPKIVVFEENLN